MEITNFTIEYWQNIKKINIFEDNELINETISTEIDRFGNPFFQFNLNNSDNNQSENDSNHLQRNSFFIKTTNSLKKTSFWCSVSYQKRDKTISVFLKLPDNKYYKSIIPFNSESESFLFHDFKEMKKLNGVWTFLKKNKRVNKKKELD